MYWSALRFRIRAGGILLTPVLMAGCSRRCPPDQFTTMSRDSVQAAWPMGLPPDWPLLVAHEPDLRVEPLPNDTELYRLIWLRAFQEPIVVRASIQEHRAEARWKVGTRVSPRDQSVPLRFPVPPYIDWSCGLRTAPSSAARAVVAAFEDADFWALPDTFPPLEPDVTYDDGATWILEARQGPRYHQVFSRVPDSTVRELGVALIKLTTIRLKENEIY
jgi:hypothetical protein